MVALPNGRTLALVYLNKRAQYPLTIVGPFSTRDACDYWWRESGRAQFSETGAQDAIMLPMQLFAPTEIPE